MSNEIIIQNRLKKNFKHLKKWAKRQQTNAFRLYDRDIPDFPFIIDILADHAIIYHLAKDFDLLGDKALHLDLVQNAINEVCQIPKDKQFIKARHKKKGQEQYEKISKEENKFEVFEGPAKFIINASDYLDTGLFLDHRPIRTMLREKSKGLKLLNLFCYTGSVSVQAALGGALTTNVDLSSTYINWAKDNFELNGLDPREHEFINQNVIEYLKEEKQLFDLIFLDPPTFSNSKKMDNDFEVERDQDDLIYLTMKRLAKDGILYFSTNKTTFKLSDKIKEKYLVKDISLKTIPEDFRNKKIHYCFQIEKKS